MDFYSVWYHRYRAKHINAKAFNTYGQGRLAVANPMGAVANDVGVRVAAAAAA